MKILHTSDWHLGKTLERADRLSEQEQFIDEFTKIADAEAVDLILIAGDVYDTNNPPAAAEGLFYQAMVRLSKGGACPVIIIAGNHDSPGRLTAPNPFLRDMGVLVIGPTGSCPEVKRHTHFSIIESGEGYFELELRGERAVFITMPYPSEKRLNQLLSHHQDEEKYQREYSQKIGMILEELSGHYRQDSINLMIGHFFVAGGEESGSERKIQLGGSMAVFPGDLPQNADYIAMGHLHRPQQIAGGPKHAYYAGSPIQYSKSETGYAKSVYVADLAAGTEPKVKKVYLSNYKPVEIWRTKSIDQAIALCGEKGGENSWVFLEIEGDRPITPAEIREIHQLKKDVLDISVVFDIGPQELLDNMEEKDFIEDFNDFYQHIRGVAPTEEIKELFLALCAENMDVDGGRNGMIKE